MGSSSVDQEEIRFFAEVPEAGCRTAPALAHPVADAAALAAIDGKAPAYAGWRPSIRATAGHRIVVVARLARLHFAQARAGLAAAVSLELARGTPFNFIPVFLAVGALGYFFAATEPSFQTLLLSAGALAGITLVTRNRTALRLVSAALLCIALGAFLAKLETWRSGTAMLGGEISTSLTGRIAATDHLASGRVRLTLDVLSTERPRLRYAPERVRVTARSIPAEARAGDTLRGFVRLMPPLGPVRPGAYDFSFESYFDGIGASGFFLGTPQMVDPGAAPSFAVRFAVSIENARDALALRIRDQIGGAEGEIAAALITGVRAGIPEDVNEALRRTGLAHVLSISGLHMALVAATIIGTMRLAFACFQDFAVRHPVRKYAAVVALGALAIYLFISGFQVAAQRSFIMIAIMLVALLFDRAALTMRNLAIAAIVVLVASPHEVVGPSFQMSFAATAALVGAYAAWSFRASDRTGPPRQGVLRFGRLALAYLLGLALTSLLAGAATTIFGAYHFQRVSPLGLAANLVAMPVVSLLVMPFAVLGVVAMPVGLDGPPFAVMGHGLRMMIAVAEWFSERSPVDAVGMVAPAAIVTLTVALILATMLTTRLRLLALPMTAIGLLLCLFPPRPIMLISEDGRLAAFRAEDGRIAVNRARPNGFALQNWERAIMSTGILKPRPVEPIDAAHLRSPPIDGVEGPGFRCTSTSCVADTGDAIVVVTSDAASASAACGVAAIIVLDDPTVADPCPDGDTLVVTRRHLARMGGAMIFRDARLRKESDSTAVAAEPVSHAAAASDHVSTSDRKTSDMSTYRAVFAIAEPHRPWHAHRQFSREARGLAPWQPTRTKSPEAGGHRAPDRPQARTGAAAARAGAETGPAGSTAPNAASPSQSVPNAAPPPEAAPNVEPISEAVPVEGESPRAEP